MAGNTRGPGWWGAAAGAFTVSAITGLTGYFTGQTNPREPVPQKVVLEVPPDIRKQLYDLGLQIDLNTGRLELLQEDQKEQWEMIRDLWRQRKANLNEEGPR